MINRQTLIKAAREYAEDEINGRGNDDDKLICSIDFIAGAQWVELQSKRMYTQDEVKELLSTQRGNCYVAVLNQCRDEKIALAAVQAPEPGGDRWKKNEA